MRRTHRARAARHEQSKFLAAHPTFAADIAEKYRPLIRDLFEGATPDHSTADGQTRVHAVADVDCFERFVIRQRVAAEREILLRWVESGKLSADLFTVR